ncbi:MAG: hypothetical protein NC833_05290 [Candidatus Omnitrophica bacterium]|nr:hypothetical protein [Candidatus Omnitrophota bacterium]
MRKKFCLWILGFYFLTLSFISGQIEGQQNKLYTPILTFTEEETGENWFANPWGGGECKAERIVDEKDEKFKTYLRVYLNNAQMTLSNPKLFKKISSNWKDKPIHGFYFWVRFTGEFTDRIHMEYITYSESEGKSYNFSNRLPVTPGAWQKVEIPLGGFCRQTHLFDIKELHQIFIITYKVTGTLDIGEIGIVQNISVILPQKMKQVDIPFSSFSVKIDGKVEIKEWSDANKIELSLPDDNTSFICSNRKPKEETKVLMKWDKDGIFFGCIMYKKDMKKLKSDITTDTSDIWKDECIEFYFLPPEIPKTIKNMRKYAVNANGKIGAHHFWRDQSVSYKIASNKYSDRWEAEFFLPWNALEMNPETTSFIGFNVTRTTYENNNVSERTGWTTTKWDGIFDFGVLLFVPQGEEFLESYINNFAFTRIDTGYYMIKGNSNSFSNYKLWIFSDEDTIYKKEGNIQEEYFNIPVNFNIKQTGNYYVQLLTLTKNKIPQFFEIRFNEFIESDLKRLPIDAIAIFPEPKEFKLYKDKKEIKDYMRYFLSNNDISFCGEKLQEELRKFYGISIIKTNNIKDADIIIGLSENEEIKGTLQKKRF